MKFNPIQAAKYYNSDITANDYTFAYLRKKLMAWGRCHFDSFPWRNSKDEFHTLIAEILLQRTKAPQVVNTYFKFINRFPDPMGLANASTREVEAIIQSLGLKWRAKLLVQLGAALKGFNLKVPDDPQLLEGLPGVGAYVSAAYLSLHRGIRAPIIDSNIVRFYGRFFGFSTGPETRRKKEVIQLADQITPKKKFKVFNYALIDFTRSICKPKPAHETCPVKSKCCYFQN